MIKMNIFHIGVQEKIYGGEEKTTSKLVLFLRSQHAGIKTQELFCLLKLYKYIWYQMFYVFYNFHVIFVKSISVLLSIHSNLNIQFD